MSHLLNMIKKRPVQLLLAGALATGAAGAPVLLTAGAAEAAACGPAVPAGTSCTLTGTLNLLAGPLTLTSPTALAWSGTLSGLDQSLVDTTTAHQSYTVVDATGSGAGWHVTASATTFTSGTLTLANAGTLVTNGSLTSITSANAPTPVCSPLSLCLLPTNTTAYPVAITTAATAPTPVTIYDTAIHTGLGSILVGGGANPVGWWLNVPAATQAGTYTSTVTMQIISGP